MAVKKCKDCGHEVSTKAKSCPNCGAPVGSKQYGLGALVLVIIVIVILIGVFSGNESSAPSGAAAGTATSDASSRIAGFQVLSKKVLDASLKDPDSAEYKDVHAYRYNLKGETTYVFCGEINAKNSFGGYIGFQRFVATPAIAATESEMKDMDKLWAAMCSPKNDAGPVVF